MGFSGWGAGCAGAPLELDSAAVAVPSCKFKPSASHSLLQQVAMGLCPSRARATASVEDRWVKFTMYVLRLQHRKDVFTALSMFLKLIKARGRGLRNEENE